jgi:hypothetical protein
MGTQGTDCEQDSASGMCRSAAGQVVPQVWKRRSSFTFIFEGQAIQQVLLTLRCSSSRVHNKTPIYFRHTQLYIIQNNQLHVSACNNAIIGTHIRITKLKLRTAIYATFQFLCVTTGFLRKVHENCAFLGYYAMLR